jgi:hypothetical protein
MTAPPAAASALGVAPRSRHVTDRSLYFQGETQTSHTHTLFYTTSNSQQPTDPPSLEAKAYHITPWLRKLRQDRARSNQRCLGRKKPNGGPTPSTKPSRRSPGGKSLHTGISPVYSASVRHSYLLYPSITPRFLILLALVFALAWLCPMCSALL